MNKRPVADAPIAGFEQFGLAPSIIKGLQEAGFITPSPIQTQAIPVVLAGHDLIAQAQTGTGKTAAFGLGAMSQLDHKGGVEMLVITPTRELASQVADELFRLGKYADIKTVAAYGGQSISRQAELIRRGAQVLVATPGRLLDHLRAKRMGKFAPKIVILDEADEMLDMGFIKDLELIFEFLPKTRQTLLFSATMPPAIQKLAQSILKDPIQIQTSAGSTTSKDIIQRYYVIGEHERTDAVVRLMEFEEPDKSIIFCRTKRETEALCLSLAGLGFGARALHGDMDQNQREASIKAYKKGEFEVLVATDIAARGLDVTGITHVFNYHLPFDTESYIHRIGRTARAGKKGVAITLVNAREYRSLERIKHATGADMQAEEVPTLKNMEQSLDAKLVQSILDQPVRQAAARIIKTLEGQIELEDLAARAVSMLASQAEASGPDQIGMKFAQIQALQEKGGAPSPSKGRKRPFKGKPRRGAARGKRD
ncbi:MAG: DEAD/DEAH box helicase [Candidatus Lambdaproteobacteria bacterium RIFOXYD2_FULL_50_16]|uniref:RNA helicase n=1 Tax=Candidatus Lambdaproteobacteria bacterium RIFOXYD2_FULL_50_16 TaxID=1817772 RepID=A0A1F6GEJ5_9PROT|nr:MAG: DEAD/DEAH box helicase [Candidatus Lambdaproteobacteria bacterium RIFOXYD2_FULL_50_16]